MFSNFMLHTTFNTEKLLICWRIQKKQYFEKFESENIDYQEKLKSLQFDFNFLEFFTTLTKHWHKN